MKTTTRQRVSPTNHEDHYKATSQSYKSAELLVAVQWAEATILTTKILTTKNEKDTWNLHKKNNSFNKIVEYVLQRLTAKSQFHDDLKETCYTRTKV